MKVRALLSQQGYLSALQGRDKLPEKLSDEEEDELMEKAHGAIILNLADSVLREVAGETTPTGLWLQLESLYMTKSLTNRLYMKQRLYTLRMKDGSLNDHINEFKKIILDLNNIDVRIEDRALILLCSLQKSYEHLVTTLLYDKETISMEDVKSALNSSQLRKKVSADYVEESANGLIVRGRRNDKASSSRGRSRPKTRSRKFKCYNCHMEGHMRRDCPDLKGKRVATGADKVAAVAEGDSDGANVLSVTDDRSSDE
ncbi:retrovirus-related pol polyprotein from transposon TNT 1-94 [Tanacetum coccineum]